MMGGMGREFDGGYAEYVLAPAAQVIPFRSDLPWERLGAVPEMLQTASGSLRIGLQAQPGRSLLIRGGTSSIGLALAVLGKLQGLTVCATTRREQARPLLESVAVDHVLIDDGNIAQQVRGIVPDGVDGAVELAGHPARCTHRRHCLLHRPMDAHRSRLAMCTPSTRSCRLIATWKSALSEARPSSFCRPDSYAGPPVP